MRSRIRIAMSVCFGVLAFALCVLWVGSYWQRSVVPLKTTYDHRYELVSAEGKLIFLSRNRIYFNFEFIPQNPYSFVPDLKTQTRLGFGRIDKVGYWAFSVAYGWLASTAIAAALVPWMRWRFGLRTLLLATTLIAVALGLVVYAVR